jgi:RimJ/RimL family protein N-acetyltransferase
MDIKEICLRALTYQDIDKTLQWHNDTNIVDFYSGHPFPVNLEMERKWYEKILTSDFPTSVFGIEHVKDQKLIGITVLRDINMINRNAECGIYIGDKAYLGRGLATDALELIVRFSFMKLGLNRIFAIIRADNISSIKLFEKIGFEREGILREHVFKDGTFIDQIIFGLLRKQIDEIS